MLLKIFGNNCIFKKKISLLFENQAKTEVFFPKAFFAAKNFPADSI